MAGPHTHEYDLTSLLPGPRYCSSCGERVCTAIAEVDGVIEATCDAELGALTVTRDPKQLSRGDLDGLVHRIALEATDSVAHAAYRLTGLD